jgi:hypothetical protein
VTDVMVLLIRGSMGAGKTTVMAEASDLLASRGLRHAAIDLDALGIVHHVERAAADLMYANLRAVWDNYRDAGVDRFLIAAAVENRAVLDAVRRSLGPVDTVVCRLRAPLAVMEERVRVREPGMQQQTFVSRVAELERLLDAAALDDFAVVNDGDVTRVARDMLVRAGWL